MFAHTIRNLAIAADPASCTDTKLILAHFGEDAWLVENAYRRQDPRAECGIPVFTYSLKARPEFCTNASLTAALPRIEAAVKAIADAREQKETANQWITIYESCNAAYGRTLLKLAGLA